MKGQNLKQSMQDKNRKERINHEIKAQQIRVIDSDGSQLGVIATNEALKIAQTKNLDLVEISSNATPPVCKIIDYQKMIYNKMKKEKEAKKNQQNLTVKEIRFTPNIGEHDIDFKCKHLEQFLNDGHKVKVVVVFKGREMNHIEFGENVMKKVVEKLSDAGKQEKEPKLEGKNLITFLLPKK